MNKDKIDRKISDIPLISIVLATYQPNIEWFSLLLQSLEKQTYQNIELIICDDASDEQCFLDIKNSINSQIHRTPIRIFRNKKNIGSNRTFEFLIQHALGNYLAFCDQDDVWIENKIEILYQEIQKLNAVLAYSDMIIIDGKGNKKANSLKKIRKRLVCFSGDNTIDNYLFHNSTAGCTIMIQTEIAKKAGRTPKYTYWDHWICIIASLFGRISYIPYALIEYRIHGGNQSGILADVITKKTYRKNRILGTEYRIKELRKRGYYYLHQKEIETLATARRNRNYITMLHYKKYCKKEIYFEMAMSCMPEVIFQYVVRYLKKDWSRKL